MATISHPAFRILVEKFGGCDEYFTEMINAGSLLTQGPFEKYYIDSTPVPEKLVWQLTGHDKLNMVEAANFLCNLPVLGLDINMGCSAPDIYKTGAGIGWMLKPMEETMDMVKGIKDVLVNNNSSMRLSVKLRLGDENFKEEDFFKFALELIDNGVQLLTLHPRTKKEKLARPPRYRFCEELAQMAQEKGVQVYLNGNVKDKSSFEYAQSQAQSCAGIMVARASVQKPWIFAQLKGNGTETLQINMEDLALEYISLVEKFQPQEFWKTRLQRFFSYYPLNFKFGHYAQSSFLNAKNNEDLAERIKAFFIQCPEEKILSINI